MSTTGIDLKLARTARRVQVQEMAAAMGVSAARISNIEARAVVTEEAARRYREALATLPSVATSGPPAEVAS